LAKQSNPNQQELPSMAKTLADGVKIALKNAGKDPRYKYMVQCVVGQNTGQGVRMGSRQFWDNDTDNVVFVTLVKKDFFVMVSAFALYTY
jgi:tctex1 domain-containing protein 2